MESNDVAGGLLRVKKISVGAYVVFAIYALISGGLRAFVGLTCTAAVTMISFLWLEDVVGSFLQSSPQPQPWRLTVRAAARFVLLGVVLLVSIFVMGFSASSVLLGFSIVVVGILGEALYGVVRSSRTE